MCDHYTRTHEGLLAGGEARLQQNPSHAAFVLAPARTRREVARRKNKKINCSIYVDNLKEMMYYKSSHL